MDVIDHKERCDLLRTYFQKVNPNSIPCTYKSNFEASAIQTLLNTEVIQGNDDVADKESSSSQAEFGPWRNCIPNKLTEKIITKSHHPSDNLKKSSRNTVNATTRPRKNKFVRSMSEGSTSSSVRTRRPNNKCTNKEIKVNKDDSSIKMTAIPIQFPYQYNDDYRQYIENYRRSYTECKLQEANQARPVAARVGLRAYDFRCGMKGVNRSESLPYGHTNRAINLKTVTLQVPPPANEFMSPASLSQFSLSPKKSPADTKNSSRHHRQ